MNAAAPSPPLAPSERADLIMKDMARWLERAVIGLNLCPFAQGVHAKGQIPYSGSDATDATALAPSLRRELCNLPAAPAE